jgi:hypothetical protein
VETDAICTAEPAEQSAIQRIFIFGSRKARRWRAFLIVESIQLQHFRAFSAETRESLRSNSIKFPVFWRLASGDARINALHGRRGSALAPQCLNQRACNLRPPATVSLPDFDLESDGRGRPDRRDLTDRSAARGACRGPRAMPKDYIGFQGGNRRRHRIAALYDARLIRIGTGRCDRIDCRGARRNRVSRIEYQYFATDDGRNERRRRAPFRSDQQDGPSSGC